MSLMNRHMQPVIRDVYKRQTLDDLYADVVGDNADYSLVEDAVDNTK